MSALNFIPRHHKGINHFWTVLIMCIVCVCVGLFLSRSHSHSCHLSFYHSHKVPQKFHCKIYINTTGCITFKWINTQFVLNTRHQHYKIVYAPLKPKYVTDRFFSWTLQKRTSLQISRPRWRERERMRTNHMTNNTLSNAK